MRKNLMDRTLMIGIRRALRIEGAKRGVRRQFAVWLPGFFADRYWRCTSGSLRDGHGNHSVVFSFLTVERSVKMARMFDEPRARSVVEREVSGEVNRLILPSPASDFDEILVAVGFASLQSRSNDES